MIDFIKSEKFILPVVYIIIGIIIYNIIKAIIGKISKYKKIDKKKITIISLIKNIIKYLVMIFVVLAILNVYGINTTSILASIGVVGVVIGLAFQDIVADFLAGVLILFDNQYTIGDWIVIDGFQGEVTSFGLMTTKIKAFTGEVLIIRNSSFKKIINYSANNAKLFINVSVSYETDIDLLEKTLNEMKEEVLKIDGVVNDGYNLLGINEFADSSIKYLITLECLWNKQYQVKRDFNKILKRHLDKSKIVIPFNQLDVHIGGKNE